MFFPLFFSTSYNNKLLFPPFFGGWIPATPHLPSGGRCHLGCGGVDTKPARRTARPADSPWIPGWLGRLLYFLWIFWGPRPNFQGLNSCEFQGRVSAGPLGRMMIPTFWSHLFFCCCGFNPCLWRFLKDLWMQRILSCRLFLLVTWWERTHWWKNVWIYALLFSMLPFLYIPGI